LASFTPLQRAWSEKQLELLVWRIMSRARS
jgi:hypothetical protein